MIYSVNRLGLQGEYKQAEQLDRASPGVDVDEVGVYWCRVVVLGGVGVQCMVDWRCWSRHSGHHHLLGGLRVSQRERQFHRHVADTVHKPGVSDFVELTFRVRVPVTRLVTQRRVA